MIMVIAYLTGLRYVFYGGVAQARLAVEEPLRNRSIRKGHGRNSRSPVCCDTRTIPKRFHLIHRARKGFQSL